MYQDKIFMQGVRPIGADNKIFLSEQAPNEHFIIHSCMSHSNSKMLAISTIKHLSRNYASFQQPSVQEWYSLSTSGQTQNIPNGISLTFMEMDTSCRTQVLPKTYELLWKLCVMLTLNTVIFKLILLFPKGKDILHHTPNDFYFQWLCLFHIYQLNSFKVDLYTLYYQLKVFWHQLTWLLLLFQLKHLAVSNNPSYQHTHFLLAE